MVRIKYFGMMAICILFMVLGRRPPAEPGRGDTMEETDKQEIEDYFRGYWGYRHSKSYEKFENDLIYYFPNLDLEHWSLDVVEDKEGGFLLEVYDYPKTRYKMQYRINRDFSLELLEDTVQVNEIEEYFCLHLGKEDYVYHGCVVQEYTGAFRLKGGGQGLKAGMPLLSVKESQGWNEVNRNIWEGLEEWYREAERLHMGEVVLEGEIKTLSPEWFSVLFRGTYRENGREEPVAVGITVDLKREKRVRRSYFQENAKTDSCYDFYMENDRIYAMDIQGGEYRCWELEQVDCAEILEERLDHSVYYENGVWALESCYDLFFVVPEGGRLEETLQVNEDLEKEMGRFLYGTKSKFAEYVLGKLDMEEKVYYTRVMGSPGDRCNVEGEVVYNNHQKIRIRYRYSVCGGKLYEKGEAEVAYDLENGTVLEYEDWQSVMEEKISDILH